MVETARAPERERFVALDSWRGIAALCVVFYHMGSFGPIARLTPFRYGWMLVDFFFVLSGFVIAMSYGRRLAHGYPLGAFLLVRLGRVYPLHIVTVAVFVALELLVFFPVLHEGHSPWELVRAVFLLDAFVRGAGNFFAPVSWAVAVELVMYVLAALLFGRGRWAIVLAAVVALVSAWALYVQFDPLIYGRLLQRGLLGFPVGVGCYWLHQRYRAVRAGAVALSVAELILVALWLALLWVAYKDASWIPLAVVLYAAMVLVFARDGGIVSKMLRLRPLVKLGQLSFALYMVHLFFIILPNRFLPRLFAATGHPDWVARGRHTFGLESVDPPAWLAVVLTFAVPALALGTAWLAWRFIEEPARHWTRRFAPHAATPAVKGI